MSAIDRDRQAGEIRQNLAARLDGIRENQQFTDAHKRSLIAKAYTDAEAKMTALRERARTEAAAEELTLEQALFSTDSVLGLSKYDPSARASATIALRDAQDRVQQVLETANNGASAQESLLAMLSRAERTGDEYMARAVTDAGLRAGYLDVLNAFVDKRPHLEPKVQRLFDIQQESNGRQARDLISTEFRYGVERPNELVGLGSLEMSALTNDAVSA
jgi:hypothetical protein